MKTSLSLFATCGFVLGCSLIIDPDIPKSASVDADAGTTFDANFSDIGLLDAIFVDVMVEEMGISTDSSQTIVDASIPDDANVAGEISARGCVNWRECYAGEVCRPVANTADLTCQDAPPDDECATEVVMDTSGNPLPQRTYDGVCCVAETNTTSQAASMGTCRVPFSIISDTTIGMSNMMNLDNWMNRSRQFDAENCHETNPATTVIDLVFEGTPPESDSEGMGLCVRSTVELTGQAAVHTDGLKVSSFQLTSCCDQAQTWDAQTCGRPHPTLERTTVLNYSVRPTNLLKYGIRLEFANLDAAERTRLMNFATGGAEMLTISHDIHGTLCCEDDEDCPEEFFDGCTPDGLCE